MLQSENLVLYDNTLTLLLLHPSASTALVEWSGVDRLQADSHCLQVLLAGTDTIVPCWQTLLDSKHRGSTVYIVCVLPRHCHCLTAVHGCQPSVTELFRSPPLVSGMVFHSTSHQHRHWPCRPHIWNGLPQHVTSARCGNLAQLPQDLSLQALLPTTLPLSCHAR